MDFDSQLRAVPRGQLQPDAGRVEQRLVHRLRGRQGQPRARQRPGEHVPRLLARLRCGHHWLGRVPAVRPRQVLGLAWRDLVPDLHEGLPLCRGQLGAAAVPRRHTRRPGRARQRWLPERPHDRLQDLPRGDVVLGGLRSAERLPSWCLWRKCGPASLRSCVLGISSHARSARLLLACCLL